LNYVLKLIYKLYCSKIKTGETYDSEEFLYLKGLEWLHDFDQRCDEIQLIITILNFFFQYH